MLGLLGVLVVIWGDQGVADIDPRGLSILLAALSWSVYFAIQKHYSHRYSPLTMACYMVWAGTDCANTLDAAAVTNCCP